MKRFLLLVAIGVGLFLPDLSRADTFGSGENTFEIEFVTIGDPRNAADPEGQNFFGAVPYDYRIGKYEISEDMIDKANAQSLLDGDPLDLSHAGRGADKPVTNISWFDAAQFVNWLNTSQGHAPAYKFVEVPDPIRPTRPPTVEFALWEPGDEGFNSENRFRNANAKYVVPTTDEWYKAAFFDPQLGSYNRFPTGDGSSPIAVLSGTDPGTAVFSSGPIRPDEPADIMLAGGASPYGTIGQGGNIREWLETEIDRLNDDALGRRGAAGGFWESSLSPLTSTTPLGSFPPNSSRISTGIRVAVVAGCSRAIVATTDNVVLFIPRSPMNRILMVFSLGVGLHVSGTALADTFGSGENAFEIEFVTIGDPGNPADTTGTPNPAGAVAYDFRMGRYEISEQMINKANRQSLIDGQPLGITMDNRGPDKPATRMSWFDAARFVNWLNLQQGVMPAYKFDGDGNFQLWDPEDIGFDMNNRFRNSRANYFLPSIDEWYKAAFYDPRTLDYWDYPTATDVPPLAIESGRDFGTAVWNQSSGPADITLAGGESALGTVGQAGNVFEWLETPANGATDVIPVPDVRAIRGDDWGLVSTPFVLSASADAGDRLSSFPAASLGFRVAAVPEPQTGAVLAAAIALCFASRPAAFRGLI